MAKPDITKYATFVIVLLISGALSLAQTQSSSAGLQVNPAQVQKKAAAPPPAGTTKASSIGQNVKVATPADSDSWAEHGRQTTSTSNKDRFEPAPLQPVASVRPSPCRSGYSSASRRMHHGHLI